MKHTYENCHNLTCRRKERNFGYNQALEEIVKLAIENGIIDYDEYYYDNGEVIISISELKKIANNLKRYKIIFKEKNMAENNRCKKCSKYGWEDGDILYDWDGGIGYDYVTIHFCPVCGNKLYKDSEKETMEYNKHFIGG